MELRRAACAAFKFERPVTTQDTASTASSRVDARKCTLLACARLRSFLLEKQVASAIAPYQ